MWLDFNSSRLFLAGICKRFFVAPLFNTGGKKESVKMIVSITGQVFIQFCPICWDPLIVSNSQGPRKAEQATYVCSVHDETSECHLPLIPLQHEGFEQFPSTPEIPPDAVQDRRLRSLPPLKRRCLVGVIVEFVVSPSQFYVHVCSTETSSQLQDLMFEMRWEHAGALQWVFVLREPGTQLLVMVTAGSITWCRGAGAVLKHCSGCLSIPFNQHAVSVATSSSCGLSVS